MNNLKMDYILTQIEPRMDNYQIGIAENIAKYGAIICIAVSIIMAVLFVILKKTDMKKTYRDIVSGFGIAACVLAIIFVICIVL